MKNRIREERAGKRMSQEELATLTGLSRGTIANIENEKVEPEGYSMIMIARKLNTAVENLFFIDE